MDGLLELGGGWLARAYAFYGMALLVFSFCILGLVLLAAAVWAMVAHSLRTRPWPSVPASVRGPARLAVRSLLMAALACVLLYAIRNARSLIQWSTSAPLTGALNCLRLGPLYLIPAVLLWDYVHSTSTPSGPAGRQAARPVPSSGPRVAPRRCGRRRCGAPHLRFGRAPLSPFRGVLERLVIATWSRNLRRELRMGAPDKIDEAGINLRTAQTASMPATGLTPDDLPRPAFYSYRDVEPVGEAWILPVTARAAVISPIPVTAERRTVVDALLDDNSNLATCALILALCERQWEAANRRTARPAAAPSADASSKSIGSPGSPPCCRRLARQPSS